MSFALIACATNAPAPPVRDKGGTLMRSWTEDERLTVELSFLAYAGFWMTDRKEAEDAVAEILGRLMPRQKIVWGPVAHQPEKILVPGPTDALLFICQDLETGVYTIVLRGTNPVSIVEWAVQDFQVTDCVSWSELTGLPAPTDALITEGTAEALKLRLGLRPGPDRAGDERSFAEAMVDILERSEGPCSLRFTGQSLGGLLSFIVPLWLVDRLEADGRRDLLDKLRLEIYAYAGPTPGNKAFAEYLVSRLAGKIGRYANDLDIATLVWDEKLMETMPSLYLPDIKLKGLTASLFKISIAAARGKEYTQPYERILVPSKVVPIKGRLYLLEAAYQHFIPYLDMLPVEREDVLLNEIIYPLVSKVGKKGFTTTDLKELIEERRREDASHSD